MNPGPSPTPVAVSTPVGAKSRRRLVLGLAGLGAGLAGAGLAWCQGHGGNAGAVSAAEQAFWGLEFETPQGGMLKLASLKGAPLVVNFWATWCPPCIEELPLLDQFYKDHAARKLQVLGLAVDKVPAVRNFLQKNTISFPMAVTGSAGLELCLSLGNTSGALPFSVMMGADGRIKQRKMGKVTTQLLKDWLA